MAASQHRNFRLRSIPIEYETKSEVCSLIQKTLGLETSTSLIVYSLALCPVDHNSKIATVSFPSIPEPLSDPSKNEWIFPLADDNSIGFGRSLVFDNHFAGFTPFQNSNDEDCHIDVIAVCGLGGHALGSFKEKNGPFVWIRDGLPSDIPSARVFTYGYDTQLVESRSFQNLSDLGRALQVDLEGIRDPNQSRSILFIGHSLGGLVIKETVRMLKEQPLEPDSTLLQAIFGFAFFGVPHRGLAVECLVPLVNDNPNRALLESLNKNSSLLERLQIEFDKISQTMGFSIVSFYETERSPTAAWIDNKWGPSGTTEVLVDVFSATCGCRQQHPINRNHSEMVKYTGVHDQLYRRVMIALRPVMRIARGGPGNVVKGGQPQVPVQISDDEQQCLRSLSFVEQEHRYSEISYAEHTCEWLLEYPQYQAWMNQPRGLFWIKGYPGTGKSVLMKFAVDMMKRRKTGELVVSFFIHGRGVLLQRTPLGMLRALLNSLLTSFSTYRVELTERFQDQQQRYGSYEQKHGWRWNEKELETLLFRLLTEGTRGQPVVIFVDALDEFGEEHAKKLLGSFKRLMEIAEREGSLVKICFSSRHFPILGHEMTSRVYVEKKNDKDIRTVIENRLRELRPDERRHRIENEILSKAHGGFQWAILVTNIVLDEDAIATRTEDLFRLISSIPPGLDELYNVILILSGATKDKHKEMTKLFQWVLFAERPLSTQELREALSTDKDMTCKTISQLRSHGSWSDNVSRFETRVRHISRGLVEFQDRDIYEQYEAEGEEWNREAQFIHQSAADFVAHKFFTHTDGESSIGLSVGSGHYQISRSFLKYLALEEILDGGDLSREKLSATFPLMPYGVSFIFRHVRAVEAEGIPQNDLIELIQWDRPERLKMLAAIWRIMDPESTHAPRGWPFVGAVLHAVIAFGSASLLDTYLQKDISDLMHRDFEGNTPLHLALRENNEDLALMILDRSMTWQTEQDKDTSTDSEKGGMDRTDYLAHFDAKNHDEETPLALAVSTRAGKAIHDLVDAGAEVKHEKSLVFYAISTGDKTLLSNLIEAGTDLAGAVFFAIQCMDRAGHSDDILHELLRDLLDAGADTKRFVGSEIDGYDEAGESDDEDCEPDEEAIFLASRLGRVHEISLLLSRESSATLTNSMGDIPLIIALYNQHSEAAKVLLQASPQTALWENRYVQTVPDLPFRIQEQFVKLLDSIHILRDRNDGYLTSRQLFELLIKTSDRDTVRKLHDTISQQIQHFALTDHPPTPLFVAVRRGFTEIVSLMFESSNINISIRDKHGNTALHMAVEKGNVSMANLLLLQDTENVLVFEEDGEGYTPLCRAIRNDDEAMVKLLLVSFYDNIGQHTADPVGFRTSLWWTVKHGTLKMIKFLLNEERLYANRQDGSSQPPLWQAIEESYEATTQLLLGSTSINMHATNKDEQTALRLRVENRRDIAIQRVLDSEKFDINKEDNTTILKVAFWAMDHEKEQTIRLLLRSSRLSTHEEIGQIVRILASWAIERDKTDMLEIIFEDKGFNLRAEDETVVRSLFYLAMEKENERLFGLIHNSGKFNIYTKNRLEKTPLGHIKEGLSEMIFNFFLEIGMVDVQATDKESDTALLIALKKGYRTVSDLLSAQTRSFEMLMEPTDGNTTGPIVKKED